MSEAELRSGDLCEAGGAVIIKGVASRLRKEVICWAASESGLLLHFHDRP